MKQELIEVKVEKEKETQTFNYTFPELALFLIETFKLDKQNRGSCTIKIRDFEFKIEPNDVLFHAQYGYVRLATSVDGFVTTEFSARGALVDFLRRVSREEFDIWEVRRLGGLPEECQVDLLCYAGRGLVNRFSAKLKLDVRLEYELWVGERTFKKPLQSFGTLEGAIEFAQGLRGKIEERYKGAYIIRIGRYGYTEEVVSKKLVKVVTL